VDEWGEVNRWGQKVYEREKKAAYDLAEFKKQ
jgi:hypothetical protein